jgi:hypothetical protein
VVPARDVSTDPIIHVCIAVSAIFGGYAQAIVVVPRKPRDRALVRLSVVADLV